MTFQHSVRVAFLDVGQGDSIVITVPATGEAVIIDCPEADTVIEYLRFAEVRHIRALIITHLHLDHYREAVNFLENCGGQLGVECERLVFNWPSNRQQLLPDADEHSEMYSDSDPKRQERTRITAYQELMTWTNQSPHEDSCVGLLRPRRGDYLEIDGMIAQAIKILQPSHAQIGKLFHLGLNNTSAVLRIEGPGSSALLTADIEPTGWSELQKHYSSLQSDVLKFPHHGSWKGADPLDVLGAVDPSIVVISVGTEGDRYDHPNPHVFSAIRNLSHIRLLCTQVTTRCVAQPTTQRQAVEAILEADAASRATCAVRTSHGCPCAGTIIVELSDQVRVLQPDAFLHRDQIINRYYGTHQCAV